MLADGYLQLAMAGGPSFIPGWTSVDVALGALLVFAVFFVLATLLAANWPFDVAFLSMIAGGILVSWPAMIALTMAAVVVAMIVSVIHAKVAPGRTARISADAERQVAPALEAFKRDLEP